MSLVIVYTYTQFMDMFNQYALETIETVLGDSLE